MKWTIIVVLALFAPFGQCMPAPEAPEVDLVVDHPLCAILQPSDCVGEKAEIVTTNCPIMCLTVVNLGDEPPVVSFGDEPQAPEVDLVVDHPSCAILQPSDCVGEKDEIVTTNCPIMCLSLANLKDELRGNELKPGNIGPITLADINLPQCEEMSPMILMFSCTQEYAEFVQAVCHEQCAPYVQKPITVISTDTDAFSIMMDDDMDEVKDHGSCIHLAPSDCVGEHAEVVKKNCPAMCSDVRATTPAAKVTDYPSCVHLMMHDCWGKHEKVVKLNCPKMCAPALVKDSTLCKFVSQETCINDGEFRNMCPLKCDLVQKPIAVIATDKGANSVAEDKTIRLVVKKAQDQ